IAMAIEPETLSDKEKLDFGLGKMVEEDPTFRVHEDPETGQTIIRGMGELHLEVIVDRLVREYNVKARAGKPQVVFRETITRAAEADGKFERQLEDEAIYGRARVRVAPRPRHGGMRYAHRLAAETPPHLVEAAMAGVREASQSGPGGYPM